MINSVELKGYIQNIKHSHNSGTISYSQCELIQGDNLIQLLFKEGLTGKLCDGLEVSIKGNLRTHSSNSHNIMYVNTYFDKGESENRVILDGEVVKVEDLFTYANGKCNTHIIIKNQLQTGNNYCYNNIPCVARNEVAKKLASVKVGEIINIIGTLKCRTYQKKTADGEIIIKVTHEVEVQNFEVVNSESLV